MARIEYGPSENPGGDHPLNLFRMLAHSPPVLAGFGQLGGALLQDAKLPPRLREMAILRTGLLAGASYEVDKHMMIARAVGVSERDKCAAGQCTADDAFQKASRTAIAASPAPSRRSRPTGDRRSPRCSRRSTTSP